MQTQQYTIAPIALSDGRVADGVLVNADGAWLGEVQVRIGRYDTVTAYQDDAGDYVPAPDGWYEAEGTHGIDVEYHSSPR